MCRRYSSLLETVNHHMSVCVRVCASAPTICDFLCRLGFIIPARDFSVTQIKKRSHLKWSHLQKRGIDVETQQKTPVGEDKKNKHG